MRRSKSFDARWKRMATAALLALGCVVVLAQTVGHAVPAPVTLPYANSYLTTGNYVSGSVDFPATGGVNGFVTGTIEIGGIPANAESPNVAWLQVVGLPDHPERLPRLSHRPVAVPVVV